VFLVPVYDRRGLDFDWKGVTDLPRVTRDLSQDDIVAVAHMLSVYGSDGTLSFNVRYAVLLSDRD